MRRASLPDDVVLPAPCKPTIMMQLGLALKFRPAFCEPRSSVSSSAMILTICWPGWTLWTTSSPMDLVLTRSMKSRATLKFTSASSNASRTSRRASPTLDSEILPRPRRLRKAFWSLLLNESNIRLSYNRSGGGTILKEATNIRSEGFSTEGNEGVRATIFQPASEFKLSESEPSSHIKTETSRIRLGGRMSIGQTYQGINEIGD